MPTSKEDLPGTLKRSPKRAQETYSKALDSAHERYGDEQRAHRVAYAALEHSFEKVGDHWGAEDEKGPSDPRAKGGKNTNRETAGGVDVEGHTKEQLYERAKKLGVKGRSKMSKLEAAAGTDPGSQPMTERPAVEPSEDDVRRIGVVLSCFVQPWNLPMNPEEVDLMAYCVLRYGFRSDVTWERLAELVAEEVDWHEVRADELRRATARDTKRRKRANQGQAQPGEPG